ncbi:Hydrocephalus-inducing protein [Harpegnathos saltator]|uniref:Hydrocephalus-inducing protein n=1 Tax=Harpegnathos saltator TaxID=610380 RepID=E2BEQ4_HARSA|nr:Hydrocephalus-inducing protein [Harpegnathos saltator]
MSYLSCLEDPEILALMDSATEPASRDSLDSVRAPPLDKMYGETCRSSFTLVNRSAISLSYKINERNLISNAGKSRRAISVLVVEPNKGSMDPLSSMEIEIEFRPALLGAFAIGLELQVACVIPQMITVKGVTGYPQIYPCVPRDDIFQRHPVELGYRAIQLLTPDCLAMKRQVTARCDDRPWSRMSEWDERILSSKIVNNRVDAFMKNDEIQCNNMINRMQHRNNISADTSNVKLAELTKQSEIPSDFFLLPTGDLWELIVPEETIPSVVDIEMAIDRLLATRFIEENALVLMKHSIPHKKAVIPHLHAPAYIIDMGYVAIDRTTRYSTTIINCGPWNAEIATKKLDKKRLESSGVVVQSKKLLLKVGETAPLAVTWQPTSARYAERSTMEQHSIHLEISRGATIPIIIKGVITYPFVTLNTKSLDFQTVIVGECLMMRVLCYASAKLKVTVETRLEERTITLHGHGVERELRISDLDIDFPPATPFVGAQEKIFTIENVCGHPVEFFWHHLDSLFPEEERAAEALIRYYGVKEILLPPRKLGERMPSFLMEFYNSLVKYQEAACRSARVLGVPLLCIDNVMIEGIALGDDQFSVESRRIIDDVYRECLSELEKYKDVLRTASPRAEVNKFVEQNGEAVANEISSEEPKSLTTIKSKPKTAIENRRYSESDVTSESIILPEGRLAKIPREQDLKFLDPVSLYECKIQVISLLRENLSRYVAKLTKDKSPGERRSAGESEDNTFLGIDVRLLTGILRERLLLPGFKKGFVLQTLKNAFFKDEIATLLVLLDIVGYVEYSLFVTFMNSMHKYIRRMEELRESEGEL